VNVRLLRFEQEEEVEVFEGRLRLVVVEKPETALRRARVA